MNSLQPVLVIVALVALATGALVMSTLQSNNDSPSPEIDTDIESIVASLSSQLDSMEANKIDRAYFNKVLAAQKGDSEMMAALAQLQEELAGLKAQLASGGGQPAKDGIISVTEEEFNKRINTQVDKRDEERKKIETAQEKQTRAAALTAHIRNRANNYRQKLDLDDYQTTQLEEAIGVFSDTLQPLWGQYKGGDQSPELLQQFLGAQEVLFQTAGAFMPPAQLENFQELQSEERGMNIINGWAQQLQNGGGGDGNTP